MVGIGASKTISDVHFYTNTHSLNGITTTEISDRSRTLYVPS
jgi:hypothetical protein